MKKITLVSLLVFALFTNCKNEKVEAEPKAAIYFENLPADSTGIDFSNELTHKDNLNIIEYLYYYNGGGVAVGDINNDGLDDIYFSANQSTDKLYLNLGNLKFQDITAQAGLETDATWSTGVTMEDVNNDGLLDIYVSKVGSYKDLKAHNLLYINKGDATFKESSSEYGLDFSGLSTQASFFDYDNDGDMDVYLMNHSVHNSDSYGDIGKRVLVDSIAGDKLFENQLHEGVATFIDVTESAQIYSSALGYGLALATTDINKDGLIDIYVGNDFHENDYLYINQGDKTFEESSASYLQHTARFTMGIDVADLNNDSYLDLFSLDMMPFDHEIFLKSGGEDSDNIYRIKKNFGFQTQYARNTLQLNRGNGIFSDIALMTETHATDWSWSSLIEDYDNDGRNDIYVTNGIYKRPNDLNYINYLSNVDFAKYDGAKRNEIEKKLVDMMPTINIPNVVFRNKGNFEFERLTSSAGQSPSYSNGAAYSDLDNDGDIDIVVNNINQKASVLENKSEADTTRNHISITLKGNDSLFNPTGSKLTLYADNHKFYKELSVNRGFQSASTRKLHYGLGTISKVDSLVVQWLDGRTQIIKDLSINKENNIQRNSNTVKTVARTTPLETALEEFAFRHLENNYVDYDREVLMPEKLSAEGPAAVQADFNGDGLDDLYLGGAKYQSPSLYLKNPDGSYTVSKEGDFGNDNIYEDVDAIALDIDNDSDLDLYVMTGGNENAESSDYLEDRIYINDGNALFRRLPLDLIKTNGGSVSSADFDKDGHLDLFIGSRSIPGNYGLSPYSFILKNNGKGQFIIVKKIRMGMVTDSEWSDINGDGELDLVVVGDWMPITVYLNQGDSEFKNATKEMGLDETYGMWNVVAVADIDKNGKNDIVAGNAGLNFKLKASPENPVHLYIDDFDDNGSADPIIFYDFFGHQVPFASKDKLVTQIPSIKKDFLDYETFSKIDNITDLTGKKIDEILEIKKLTELRSMAYFNKNAVFTAVPLPKEAQMSSVEDLLITTEDEKTRITFVGNYMDYTNELGNSDANSGGVLKISENQKISFEKYLPLPAGLNSRKILKVNDTTYLVISNNDNSYLIDPMNNR
ncbi:RNA-binding protein [Aggregatimonas sangjinii]|uniref:RNA-binding protein n=1 Tax=Aggregatimonas sangjinii TaxID=2583587 RepID=A0A5B7SNQ4_9FLAO|nr:VCBS repeat-containing protein [Aggregatimonas sangjinii]QCW98640.1 RNA-binding protein [Aggregatimonas sangjinii]